MEDENKKRRRQKRKRKKSRRERKEEEEEDGWRFWLSSVNEALTAKDRLTTFSVKDQ